MIHVKAIISMLECIKLLQSILSGCIGLAADKLQDLKGALLAGPVRRKRLRPENISPITSSKGPGHSLDGAANGVSTAEDTGILTQVVLVEADEKEHLGELDLHQLDSFKYATPPPPPPPPSPPTPHTHTSRFSSVR